jgi:DNA-directed RNA polymerase specialized sigma24 family protein
VHESPRWHQVEPATLRECIGELPTKLREPLLLALAGHSAKEIARRLGIRLGTVGTRTFRARLQLRRLLERRLEGTAAPLNETEPSAA